MWGWNEEGFGGLRSASTEQLEEALVGAWQTPGLRHLLIGDLPPSQRQPTARKLAHIVSNLKPPPPLVLTSLIYKGHRVLVEHTSLRLGKQWQGERDRQKALKAPPIYGCTVCSIGGGGASSSSDAMQVEPDEVAQLNNFAREPKPVPTKAMVEKRARMLAASNCHGVKLGAAMAAAMADEAAMTALAQGKSKEEAAAAGAEVAKPFKPVGGDNESFTEAVFFGRETGEKNPVAQVMLSPPGVYASISQIRLRRGVTCSCPAQTGWIFGCRGPVTVEMLYDRKLKCFDNVTEWEFSFSVAATEMDSYEFGYHGCHTLYEHNLYEAEVVEFNVEDDGEDGIFPIAWFHFPYDLERVKEKQEEDPDWKETGEFIVNLKKKRCCSLVFAKIVDQESRMEGYGDDHTEPNIDLEHLSVSGHVVDTGLWGPLAAAHEEVEPVEDDADSDDESDGSLH